MNKPLILQHTSKSSNGRSARSIVLYGRCAVCFGLRWKPTEGWVWPANTRSKHMEHDTLRVQHKNALKESKVPPFVIYSFRHTFLTRLGESGCDAWTLARIAGHSNIAISQRYVPRLAMQSFRQCLGWMGTILGTTRKWCFQNARKARR
jgi:hypothetical protein